MHQQLRHQSHVAAAADHLVLRVEALLQAVLHAVLAYCLGATEQADLPPLQTSLNDVVGQTHQVPYMVQHVSVVQFVSS